MNKTFESRSIKALLIGQIQKDDLPKETTPSLTKFANNIVRVCQFALDVKWENHNNAQICRKEIKHKQKKTEQLNWYRFSPTEE